MRALLSTSVKSDSIGLEAEHNSRVEIRQVSERPQADLTTRVALVQGPALQHDKLGRRRTQFLIVGTVL